MKFLLCISLCAFVTASLIDVAKAYELRGRGSAGLMDFGISNTTNSLDKRGSGRGTWYNGADLKAGACYDRNGLPEFNAKEKDMIGAMAMNSFENCYKCMEITNDDDKKKKIVVKIVDKCAGCKVNKAIDLTPAAFKKLGDLNKGVLAISWKVISCPSDIYPKMGPNK